MSGEGDDGGQPRRRRSSLAELFASRPPADSFSAQVSAGRPHASSISASVTQQAQQQSRTRRLSITTLGLSGSPTQGNSVSPFGSLKRGSLVGGGIGQRTSIDQNESAIEDDEPGPLTSSGSDGNAGSKSRPIGRRLSFGAKAYRDVRTAGSGSDSGSDSSSPPVNSMKPGSPPTASRGSEGFNWSENLLNRAKRTSISTTTGFNSGVPSGPLSSSPNHVRANTVAVPQQTPLPPAPKPLQKVPDHFQERILKGDFYMD